MTIAALATVLGGAAQADRLPIPTVPYSADIRMDVRGREYTGHINVDGDKERRDIQSASGVRTVTIIRRDSNKVFDLRPKRHLAVVMRIAAAEAAGATGVPGIDVNAFYGVDATPIGTETVAGETANKYKVKVDSGPDLTVDATVWVTEDGIVIKSIGKTSIDIDKPPASIALTNLKRGPQDPALFELPPGMSVLSPDAEADPTDPGTPAQPN